MREGKEENTFPSLPSPTLLLVFCSRPNFRAGKHRKSRSSLPKSTETLATQASAKIKAMSNSTSVKPTD